MTSARDTWRAARAARDEIWQRMSDRLNELDLAGYDALKPEYDAANEREDAAFKAFMEDTRRLHDYLVSIGDRLDVAAAQRLIAQHEADEASKE